MRSCGCKIITLTLITLLTQTAFATDLAPKGDFVLVDIRRSADAIGPPEDPSLKWDIGQTLSLAESLTLPDGSGCPSWSAAQADGPAVNIADPILSDTQIGPIDSTRSAGDRVLNRSLELRCGAESALVVLQVDRRVLVTSSPSGLSYLVFEAPLNSTQLQALQGQLQSMKYLEEEPSGEWTDATRSALAYYAEYRGAEYRFHRAAITENLLDGLGVLPPPQEEVLKVVYGGDVSAWFYGEPVELGPPEYGTQRLHFRFKEDPREYAFNPIGTLEFSDWSTNLFSNDGSLVALLQDRYGPYHIVKTEELREYLADSAEPNWIVSKPPRDTELDQASVHSNLKWTSESSLEFTHTCCGDPIGMFWQVPDDKYARECDRDTIGLYRSGVADQLPAQPTDLSDAYQALGLLNNAAINNPGNWVDGAVELGAEPNQYRPSDQELLACVAGRDLVYALNGSTYNKIASQWRGAAQLPPAVSYKQFRFREVEVMGSGLQFHSSPPTEIAFGPWQHGMLPPALR